MKCNNCWRKASWSMKIMLYGHIFYKHICTYHFLKDEISSWNIKENLKEELSGES